MPISVGKDKLSGLANRLNLFESQGQSPAPFLGSWCAMGSHLWFGSFIPAVLGQNLSESARTTVLYNWAIAQIVRSSWARTLLSSSAASDPSVGQLPSHQRACVSEVKKRAPTHLRSAPSGRDVATLTPVRAG